MPNTCKAVNGNGTSCGKTDNNCCSAKNAAAKVAAQKTRNLTRAE